MIDKYESAKAIKPFLEKYQELKNLKKDLEKGIEKYDSRFPLNIYVEPTNICNLNCKFCYRDNIEREINYLSLYAFNNIINKLPKGSVITFTGNGEPLMNINTYEMISIANTKGFKTRIITNGTALNKKNAKKLIDSNITNVVFSFDSIDKDTYEKLRVNSKYFDTLKNILYFIKLARDNNKNIFITISSVQSPEVIRYNKNSKIFWSEIPIDNYFEAKLLNIHGESKMNNKIEKEEEYDICTNPWITMKVNSDASTNICALDINGTYNVGSFKNSNFNEIYNSQDSKKLRKALINKEIDFFKEIGYNCHLCNNWNKNIGNGINSFLNESLPIRLSLTVSEYEIKDYPEYKMKNLYKYIEMLENGTFNYKDFL